MAFSPGTLMGPSRLVADPELSPLDLAIAPNGNIVVSSERPFGAVDAVTSVREYDTTDGHLVRVLSPNGKAEFCKPRGLRFAPNGLLYCVARDEVVGFDFSSGQCLGAIVRMRRFNRIIPGYSSVKMTRDVRGYFVVEFHTKGEPLTFTARRPYSACLFLSRSTAVLAQSVPGDRHGS